MVGRRSVARGRGGRTQTGSSAAHATAMVRRLEHRVNGYRVVPAPHPTTFVERPWNSWTFEKSAQTTEGALSLVTRINDVITQIRSKCAIAESGNNILLKVLSASGWVTAAGLIYPDLQAVFYELSSASTSGQAIRSQQRDKGTLNMPAKAGYVYPMSDQKEILSNDDANTDIFTCIAGAADSIVTARVHVLWQSST